MTLVNQAIMRAQELRYGQLLEETIMRGEARQDRTGVGTRMFFAPAPLRFELLFGFPLMVGKKVHARSVFAELCWFLRGDTNVRWLQEHGCTIWDEWADHDGNLGPVYGRQWRDWGGHDQIMNIVHQLATDPGSCRAVLNAWNVADVPSMALPPCHYTAVFGTTGIGQATERLNCLLTMRSSDLFLGLPFNIASYAALAHVLCAAVNRARENARVTPRMRPGVLTVQLADAHVYSNHHDAVEKYLQQLTRVFLHKGEVEYTYGGLDFELPGSDFHLKDLTPDCFRVTGYNPMPACPAPVAV